VVDTFLRTGGSGDQIGRGGIDPARGIERLTSVDGVTARPSDAASSIHD